MITIKTKHKLIKIEDSIIFQKKHLEFGICFLRFE